MRLGIFAACFLVAWPAVHFGLAPAGIGKSNVFWIALLALILSAPVSFVVLRGQRDAMSEQIVHRVDRAKAKLAASRSQEDDADDAARAQGAS
ncbi:DUF4229 domain-containing protein [Streptomyces sp. GC420]|nr:DUF4229 domain-containing protein [Streptomyces sp. GC420]NBM15424.1 DUF4229 domain-containing protein [Streptomyces sp. GC420]